ncbi:mechanosensitive ion channel, partial [Akkermansiaceae bacterium]|nr:mechanosensitive ion channel [Akkermansiaceae bacterium]
SYEVEEVEKGLQEHRIALVKLKQDLSADPPSIPDDFSNGDKAKVKALLKERNQAYNTLKRELDLAIEHDEAALDASEKVLKVAAELQAFVMPRIFWFRGADSLGVHTVGEINKEFYQARDEVWKLGEELSGESFKLLTVANVTIILVLFVILPAIFLWTGKRLRAAVPEPGVKGRRKLLAFGMFIRSFFPGLFVLSFAFLVRSSSFPEDLLVVATVFILELSLTLLVVMPVRSFCNVNGLGVRIFGLTTEVARWFRRFFTNASILFFLLILLPATLGTQLADWSVIPFVSYFFFKLGVAVLTWLALRRSKAMAQYVMVTKGRTSFLWKNWNLITGLILLVLLGTLVGDILGYRFAAESVFVSMMLTAFLGFVMFSFFKPAEAAALRLSTAHAIAWKEALTEEATVQSEEGAEVSEKKSKEEIKELDAASRDRTKALVRTLFLIFGLTSLIGIWNTDGRLYYAFDQFTLFSTEDSRFSLAGVFSAALILLVGVSVARTLPAFFELFIFPRFDIDSGLRYAIVSITRYAFLAIVAIVILNILQVNFASLGWLVAALGVGLGFGLQEIVSNFVSGIIILVERPIRVGDVVTVGGQTGAVSRINIRATTITNWDRLEMIIPNKDFITKEVTNWTLSSALTRIVVPIGVAYGIDPDRVKKLLLKIAAEDDRITDDPAPMALFKSHGASSLDFELRVYVPELGNRVWVEDSLISSINRVLTEEGIEIPFPQQDVYLHQVPEKRENAPK